MTERATKLLVLDLDGTVRKGFGELGHFVNCAADVEVFPEAVKRIRAWKRDGGRVIAVSNQGGISLGYCTAAQVAGAMIETNRQCDNLFDKIAWCQHHPMAKDPEYARCWCRKPSPGLLIEAAIEIAERFNEYYPPYMGLFVGDREEDSACAKLAGFDFMDAIEWRGGA